MVLKRSLVDQGVAGAKSASSKDQLIQIILDSNLDARAIIAAAGAKKLEEAELKAKLDHEKARKDGERQAASEAASAAAKLVAAELSASFTGVHTPQRLAAFVEENIDDILASGLLSATTCDGCTRMRAVHGVYTIATCERGCDYAASPVSRGDAVACICAALDESFHQMHALDANASLQHPQYFQTAARFEISVASLQHVLRKYVSTSFSS
jgi:hypothetical protein